MKFSERFGVFNPILTRYLNFPPGARSSVRCTVHHRTPLNTGSCPLDGHFTVLLSCHWTWLLCSSQCVQPSLGSIDLAGDNLTIQLIIHNLSRIIVKVERRETGIIERQQKVLPANRLDDQLQTTRTSRVRVKSSVWWWSSREMAETDHSLSKLKGWKKSFAEADTDGVKTQKRLQVGAMLACSSWHNSSVVLVNWTWTELWFTI